MRFLRHAPSRSARAYPFLWVAVYASAFVLWVLFLAVGVASQPALSAALPAVFACMPERGVRQVLLLEEGGRISLNREEVASSGLAARLRQVDPEERQVLFVIGPGVPFREVAQVWRLAREAGVTDILIVSMEEAP